MVGIGCLLFVVVFTSKFDICGNNNTEKQYYDDSMPSKNVQKCRNIA